MWLPHLIAIHSASSRAWHPQVWKLAFQVRVFFLVWRKVVIWGSRCSLYRFSTSLPIFIQTFQFSLQISPTSNFELWGCYTADTYCSVSCPEIKNITLLSEFVNFIDIFCPWSSHFPFFVLQNCSHCPCFTVALVGLWVMFLTRRSVFCSLHSCVCTCWSPT